LIAVGNVVDVDPVVVDTEAPPVGIELVGPSSTASVAMEVTTPDAGGTSLSNEVMVGIVGIAPGDT
jgi:hypothetical protein